MVNVRPGSICAPNAGRSCTRFGQRVVDLLVCAARVCEPGSLRRVLRSCCGGRGVPEPNARACCDA